jgi:hypothetical protein
MCVCVCCVRLEIQELIIKYKTSPLNKKALYSNLIKTKEEQNETKKKVRLVVLMNYFLCLQKK